MGIKIAVYAFVLPSVRTWAVAGKEGYMIVEVGAQETNEFIRSHNLGHLGCVLEGNEPYVVPVNYFYKDKYIYVHSATGLKIDALRKNPSACLQVDDIKHSFEWQSAIAFGEFEEINDLEQKQTIFQEFAERLKELTPVEDLDHGSGLSKDVILFRIKITRITGRAEK